MNRHFEYRIVVRGSAFYHDVVRVRPLADTTLGIREKMQKA